jgi:hypothetical protein
MIAARQRQDRDGLAFAIQSHLCQLPVSVVDDDNAHCGLAVRSGHGH